MIVRVMNKRVATFVVGDIIVKLVEQDGGLIAKHELMTTCDRCVQECLGKVSEVG